MKVINYQKESSRYSIINDLRSNLTSIGAEIQKINEMASLVDEIVRDSYIRADTDMRDSCSAAQSSIVHALSILKDALQLARQLDISEEISS